MSKFIVDTNVLITACKFSVRGVPVIKLITDTSNLIISSAVHEEVVSSSDRYPDALVARELIEAGTIEVRGVRFREYDILNRYKLGKGEKESIALAIEMNEDVDFIVTDDRLAYIVMKRMELNTPLFLDLIVTLVERDMLTREVASGIVRAVESRYPEGFIYHTIKILEMGARRWLS
ncbi:MAG TPA: hypothetical protein ENN68_04150 [Methanomicrobia archaeon]|nr:hypothetical protein [Methanomicrobia archaeon]